jgi:hypothetical protein
MPKGPQGQKRPADVIGAAVLVGRIATGEVEDTKAKAAPQAKSGKARAKALTPRERAEAASVAATARTTSAAFIRHCARHRPKLQASPMNC